MQAAGVQLAEELHLAPLGTEGHDLICACVHCDSHDAMRVHCETGVAQCYSCGHAWSPFDLAKVVLGDHERAIDIMVKVGLFEPRQQEDKSDDGTEILLPPADLLDEVAQAKGCTRRGLERFRAAVEGRSVVVPMYGPDGQRCSTCALTASGKGLYEKGKPTGLFLPGVRPAPGDTWVVCEGVKDASVLADLGYTAAGLPGNVLKKDFVGWFRACDVVLVPDLDRAGQEGAKKTAELLRGVARSVRVAKLPGEITESRGIDVRDVVRTDGPQAVRAAVERAKNTDPDQCSVDFGWLTAAELDRAELGIEYLVDGVLAARQPGVIVGPAKTLKTSLAVELAISLAGGDNMLGQFRVTRPLTVGLMSGESGLAILRETCRRICQAREWKLPDLGNFLHISGECPKLTHVGHLQAVRRDIESRQLQVAILDPLYRSIPGANTASLNEMGEVFEAADKIATQTGCTLILVHHTVKRPGFGVRGQFEPPEMYDMHGAGIMEWARQWVMLGRRERYIAGTGEHRLWLAIGGSAGHGSSWAWDLNEGVAPHRFWDSALFTLDEAREGQQQSTEEKQAAAARQREEKYRAAIINAMIQTPEGETQSAIRDRSGISTPRFREAFATLLKDRTIEECQIRKHGKTYTGFRICDDAFNAN